MSSANLQRPYYAVIFTSLRTAEEEDYPQTAQRMLALAAQQDGFLHVDSVREADRGITVSYWRDLESIQAWKRQVEHLQAQQMGRDKWYSQYQVRICKVEREYDYQANNCIR